MLMNVRFRPNQLKPCKAPDLGAGGLFRRDTQELYFPQRCRRREQV